MAEDNIYPKGHPKQTEDFAVNQKLKQDVYDTIKEVAQDTLEKAFIAKGYKKTDNYKGEYADGKKYGAGSDNDKFNVIVNGKTNTVLEKVIILGTKKSVSEISIDIKAKAKIVEISYRTTSNAAYKSYDHDTQGPLTINEKLIIKITSISAFKKELKEKFEKFAKIEVAYITRTKIAVDDKIDKNTNSMIENKKTLKSILDNFFNVEIDRIMESKEDSEKNSPEVIKSNSPGKLLFDDISEIEEGDYKELAKKEMKKWNVKSPSELKPSEKKQFFDDLDKKWTSKDELDEITTAGSAAVGAIGGEVADGNLGTAGNFKYAANPFVYKKKGKKKINEADVTIKEASDEKGNKLEDTNYYKSKEPRAHIKKMKNEGESFWTSVDIEPLKKDHIAGAPGMMGVDVNSSEEEEMSMTRNRYGKKEKINENVEKNPSIIKESMIKRKFITNSENDDKNINKRYIISEKRTQSEESDRWKKLSIFERDETIKGAENIADLLNECGCEDKNHVSREEGEQEISNEFEQRNSDLESGDQHNGKKIIVVMKPNSLSNSQYKVYEDEYLNESRAYIFDFTTGNFVSNPNFKPVTR